MHLALPSEEEASALLAHRRAIDEVTRALQDDPRLTRAFLGHPWFTNFDDPDIQESVLGAPEVLSAMVIYLHRADHECAAQRTFLGVEREQVPGLDRTWLQILLTHFLFTDPEGYDALPQFRAEVRRRLALANAIDRRRVHLGPATRVRRTPGTTAGRSVCTGSERR